MRALPIAYKFAAVYAVGMIVTYRIITLSAPWMRLDAFGAEVGRSEQGAHVTKRSTQIMITISIIGGASSLLLAYFRPLATAIAFGLEGIVASSIPPARCAEVACDLLHAFRFSLAQCHDYRDRRHEHDAHSGTTHERSR